MALKHAIEIIDTTLRDIMDDDYPFNGKIVIKGGDFEQPLLVQVGTMTSEVVDSSVNYSIFSTYLKKFSLKKMRALGEQIEFSKFLLNFNSFYLYQILLLKKLTKKFLKENNIYKQLIILFYQQEILMEMKLMKKWSIYWILLLKKFISIDIIDNCDNEGFNQIVATEDLNNLNPPSIPQYQLKINSIMKDSEGLFNATRLLILDLYDNVLKFKVITGDKKGEIVFINRITLYSLENEYPFIFKRRQLPVKLAFTMTIRAVFVQGPTRLGPRAPTH
ncbi:uncharacterized protein LOC131663568 [Phymastichus coffea]|uniref:uncharacterized protein LOC131663568 n=1 Tax=Phymastichus coffea TaxID=108790 RepID=UPI00273BBA8B|nr:uncharacterized protein LOC131663568 [Phymastichus coffea]